MGLSRGENIQRCLLCKDSIDILTFTIQLDNTYNHLEGYQDNSKLNLYDAED